MSQTRVHRSTDVVLSMLKFNLQWYSRVMRDILFRYKILALFSILLLCPTLASLVNLLTFPLKSLFLYPVSNAKVLFCSLFLYQVFSVIWLSIQYGVVFKRSWQKYFETLPVSNIQKKLMTELAKSVVPNEVKMPVAEPVAAVPMQVTPPDETKTVAPVPMQNAVPNASQKLMGSVPPPQSYWQDGLFGEMELAFMTDESPNEPKESGRFSPSSFLN